MSTTIRDQIQEWRVVTEEKLVLGAQDVQDRLLDIYGSVKNGPAAPYVEEYLSLTVERTLFEQDEISKLLDDIEANLPEVARN